MNDSDFEAALAKIEHSWEEKRKIKAAIASELYGAFERLNAPPDLLSIIGSYGDTLEDSEVLQLLKEWNATGKILHERQ